MSKYTTVENVAFYYQGVNFFQADSIFPPENVMMMIEDESAYVDAKLRSKYDVPLTNADDIRLIKKIVEYRVVAIIDGVMRENDVDGKFNYKRNTNKRADDLLDEIVSGKVKLNTTRYTVSSSGQIDSSGHAVKPYFKIENASSTPVDPYLNREFSN